MLEEGRVISHGEECERNCKKNRADGGNRSWNKMGVRSVKQWCEKIEDREWLASRIGGKKKGKRGTNDRRGNAMQSGSSNGL